MKPNSDKDFHSSAVSELRVVSCLGQALTKHYVPDVICFDQIIAELKVSDRLTGVEAAQVLNYLKATHKRAGLLINFGSRGALEWKRYVL